MVQVSRSVLLNYTVDEMFSIVNDIESYPQFVPNCIHGEVHEDLGHEMLATISFKALGLKQALTTRNRIVLGESISMSLVEGPFSKLEGSWEFIALSEAASKVICTLSFKPKSRYARFAAKPALNKAANSALDGFNKRVVEVYGKR